MDHNDKILDELLSQQQKIEDIDFSSNVMRSLPQRQNQKRRAFILLFSTSLGSLAALFLLLGEKSTSTFFHEIFEGLTRYQAGGLALTIGILALYTTFFLSTHEEIG